MQQAPVPTGWRTGRSHSTLFACCWGAGAGGRRGRPRVPDRGEIIPTRIFNLGQLRSEVGFSNKVPADDRRLHLLIYGKVRLNEEDEKGRWGHWWV